MHIQKALLYPQYLTVCSEFGTIAFDFVNKIARFPHTHTHTDRRQPCSRQTLIPACQSHKICRAGNRQIQIHKQIGRQVGQAS